MAKAKRRTPREIKKIKRQKHPVSLRLSHYEANVLYTLLGDIGDGCYLDESGGTGPVREALNEIYYALDWLR